MVGLHFQTDKIASFKILLHLPVMLLLYINFASFLAQPVAVGLAWILIIVPVSSMHIESFTVTKCLALHPTVAYSLFFFAKLSVSLFFYCDGHLLLPQWNNSYRYWVSKCFCILCALEGISVGCVWDSLRSSQ